MGVDENLRGGIEPAGAPAVAKEERSTLWTLKLPETVVEAGEFSEDLVSEKTGI